MKRAAVILTSVDRNPFYGIVTFDDDEQELDEAVQQHFRENWEAPEGDSPDDWFEDILGDYTYFYIGHEAAEGLVKVEIPEPDTEGRLHPDELARMLLEQLMISVCEQFAYTSCKFTREEGKGGVV